MVKGSRDLKFERCVQLALGVRVGVGVEQTYISVASLSNHECQECETTEYMTVSLCHV